MASNSDSIYYVLTKLQHHPELVKQTTARYTNTVMILFDDSLKIANSSFYFPVDRLMVNRLAGEFVAKNGDLLEEYFAMTKSTKANYHDVWATTSHIPAKKVFLLELSYE
jgi:phage-related baseplate assembly protein